MLFNIILGLLIFGACIVALIFTVKFVSTFSEKITLHEHSSRLIAFCIIVTTYSSLTAGADIFANFLGYDDLPMMLDIFRFIIGLLILLGLIVLSKKVWKHRATEK